MRSTKWQFGVVAVVSVFSPPSRSPAEPLDLGKAIREATADGLTSDPTAVSWSANRIDVFARGPDNALWHKWYDGQWSGWESLGGSLASGPDVASWGSGRLDVFVRGTDNTLQHKWYDGQWSQWENLGGGLSSDPAAVSWGPGRLDVFARGADNGLWHRWYANGWSGWEGLGGTLASAPDVASWGSGRLDVFVRGTDNTLQHKWYSGQWSGWEGLGGGLSSDPSAVSWGAGRIDVFARGADNGLWHRWYANTWSGWESLGGGLSSGPDASTWGSGRLDVFARGMDNTLYHRWYSGGWSGWEALGAPSAIANLVYATASATVSNPTSTPQDPAGFTAAQTGEGQVKLTWQPVSGVTTYLVGGPGTGTTGFQATGTTVTLNGIPTGTQQWTVASLYNPGGLRTTAADWPKATLAVIARSGRYRVSLNGALVVRATPHDLLELDGKGDEVYFLSQVERFDRGNGPTGPYQVESKYAYAPSAVYGDVNTFPNRIRSGSRTASGGLQEGDWVPMGVNVMAPYAEPLGGQLPLLIWSGTLRDGRDVLLVHPVVMEWVGSGLDGHMGAGGLDGPTIFRSDKCPKDQQYLLPAVQSQLGTLGLSVVQELPIGEDIPHCNRPTEKRFPEYGAHAPIGLLVGTNDPGSYIAADYFLILTREKLEAAMGSRNWAIGQVQRRHFGGGSGVYIVYVLIERLP